MAWTNKSPLETEWHQGEVPPVEEVPYDSWCNDTYMPYWGGGRPTGWWAWIKVGTKPRPADVKPWEENRPGCESYK